jgi:hypothetical protein
VSGVDKHVVQRSVALRAPPGGAILRDCWSDSHRKGAAEPDWLGKRPGRSGTTRSTPNTSCSVCLLSRRPLPHWCWRRLTSRRSASVRRSCGSSPSVSAWRSRRSDSVDAESRGVLELALRDAQTLGRSRGRLVLAVHPLAPAAKRQRPAVPRRTAPTRRPELAPPDSSKSAITSSRCCTAISSVPAETMFVEPWSADTRTGRSHARRDLGRA